MLKPLIKSSLTHAPVWPAACAAVRPAGVTVLMYHRIKSAHDPFPGTDVHSFAEQMAWLSRHCRVITPEELDAAARLPRQARPPVLLTFDDGYRDYHDNAAPVLRRHGFTGVVFLATGAMDDRVLIWTDAVTCAARITPCSRVQLPWAPEQELAVSDEASRAELAQVCKRFLKDIPDRKRQEWLDRLLEAMRVNPNDGSIDRQMLSWDEVRATMDCTRYGGHTHNHPILSQLDAQTMEDEIATCRQRIVDETGQAPRYFAYPNGRAQDFTPLTQQLLRKHGFTLGFSTIEGLHRDGDDLFAIRRQHTAADTLGDFALRVLGR